MGLTSGVHFVGVVAYNETANSLSYDGIKRARDAFKTDVKEQVSNFEASGTTNYEEAFLKVL